MDDHTGTPLAVVTGASTGIGREFARLLAASGHDLVVTADEPGIHAVARELAAGGRVAVPVQADLTSPQEVERLYAAVSELHRPVAVAVLNAGTGAWGRFDRSDLDAHLRVVDLNVRATVHLAHLFARDMVEAGGGQLLLTASIAGLAPGPGHATYAASKAFVHSFAGALRHELRGTGVTVTSLLPGPTDTPFFDRVGMGRTRVARGPKDDPAEVARAGLAALQHDKDQVVAGRIRNKLQAAAAGLVPDRLAAAIASRETDVVDDSTDSQG